MEIMKIIYLPGYSVNNKEWVEKLSQEFEEFGEGEIVYYDHWKTGKSMIIKEELRKVEEIVRDEKDYMVIAKSVGTALALREICEGKINPKKAIFLGSAFGMGKRSGWPIDEYLKVIKIPILFIQNEFDPIFSFEKLENLLKESKPKNYELVMMPKNRTHKYEEYEILKKLAREFFNKVTK